MIGAKIRISLPKRKLAAFCRQNNIVKLALFGSVLRDDFGSDSDIDVLVEFDKGHVPGFLRLASMERELSSFLGGRKVDMRTAQDLSPYFRDAVVAEAEEQYAQRR